ncbi:MAG: prephenate dehydratase [Patescibacteria group bacterium]|nr:prephenate dehydratase [Patescibacteria group bacterium]
MNKKTIGCLGPERTFSHKAAEMIKDSEEIIVFFPDFTDLINAFIKGGVEKIIVPIENSIAGFVVAVLDGLIEKRPFGIEKEVVIGIDHFLVGFGSQDEIKTIYSHPQGVSQCFNFINDILRKQGNKIEIKTTSSTATAIQLVAETEDNSIAAIGSKEAAERYKVPVIRGDIGNFSNNQTRFLLLSNKTTRPTGNDKTTIIFRTENKNCSLAKVLLEFGENGINITMINSMPSKKELGDYIFFMDIEGHQDDEDVKIVISNLKSSGKVKELVILGSYTWQ